MFRFFVMLSMLGCAAATQAAAPSINIGAMHDYMAADSTRLSKLIRNNGDAVAYVRVEISQIVFNADGSRHEVAVDGVGLLGNGAGTGESGLVASPSRLIIPANGGQQSTNLVWVGDRSAADYRASERYYRVRFVPVVPDDSEFSLDGEQLKHYKEQIAASVSVLTGYGSVLFVAPAAPVYATTVSADVVHNNGTATVVLDNLRMCEKARPKQCSAGMKVHVRPGQSHRIQRDEQQMVRFELIEGPVRSDMTLPD